MQFVSGGGMLVQRISLYAPPPYQRKLREGLVPDKEAFKYDISTFWGGVSKPNR